MRAAHFAQDIDIAATRFAKGEVFTRDNSRNPKPFNEQFDDEIFGKIEKMRFKQFLGWIKGWTDAQICRAVQNAAIGQAALHRINAVTRAQIMAHVDIGGGKAQKSAVFVTMLDNTLNCKGSRQQRCGGFAVAILQRSADAA